VIDPVTRVLVERERSRPRLLPWVATAVLLHAGAAAATYMVGKRAAARPVQLPSVSVRVVRQEAPSRRSPSRDTQRSSTPVPQPSKPPATAVPKPSAVATAPPAPPVEAPKASTEAMRSEKSSSTPVPTPPPAPPESGAGGGSGDAVGGGRGLSVGGESTAGGAGIPSDFHFTYYVDRMLALIESRWYKPVVPAGTRARVGFVIFKDGRLDSIRLEESSGNPSFDRAALRAIYAANPLPPLPPAYGKPSLTVHLSFSE
jgi:protein TonB